MAVKKTAQAAQVAEEVKEDIKTAAQKAEKAVKTTADKAKKTVKSVTKTAKAKKETAEKSESVVFIQMSGKEEVNVNELIEACKADYKAKGHRAPKDVTVYVKPEEGVAYYTVNGKGSDDFKVDL